MTFGEIAIKDALGAILAHRTAGVGKGTVLKAEHLDTLSAAGLTHITAAQLGPDDLHEDSAAAKVAAALTQDPAITISAAHTGRVNLIAAKPGLVRVEAEEIHALNRIDPMITVATLPPLQRVEPNQLIATIKIISYGVDQISAAASCEIGKNAIGLHLPQPQKIGLIETTLDAGYRGEKGQRAVADRLNALGLDLSHIETVPHNTDALAQAIKATQVDTLAILTASATSDINDTAPKALTQAGGEVIHFGMPVDPGNLLFIGQIGQTKVIGLPGCARSPALNGADWVLERMLCGLEVSPRNLTGMGVGGLLKEIPQRGKPRREIG